MDKNTLSNYGWIVIAVLVLAVMIALATPFGKYIESGVRSTTAGLFDTSEKAMNVVGMSAGEGNFEDGYQTPDGEDKNNVPVVVGSATFDDGTTLTWEELQLAENGDKYGYDASAINNTSIGDNAFNSCYSITNITIPNSVTSIGDKAFYMCGLTDIIIPCSVTSISDCAFAHSSLTSITIPDSVTSIGDEAFYYCALPSITIPDSVTSIGNSAFGECYSLKDVVIPNSVTSIGSFAFGYCYSLTNITIPDSITSIDNSTFMQCSTLTNITISSNVTSIGDEAFKDCYSLTNITIPDSVTSIGDYAFDKCENLESITFDGTKAQWNAISLGEYWNGYDYGYVQGIIPATVVHCTDGDVTL